MFTPNKGDTVRVMLPVEVVQNYGEDGKPDDGGCFTEHHTEWECVDRAACRANICQASDLMKTIAHFADQEAAEDGRSGIGRGGPG